jgi:hypothetical protein
VTVTNAEYRSLIGKLIPFAQANVRKWHCPKGHELSDEVDTMQDGDRAGWGIDPLYLVVEDGQIVRFSEGRHGARWVDVNIETAYLSPDGDTSGRQIVAMLDRLATQLLPGVPVQVPPDYPLDEVRRVLGGHEFDRANRAPERRETKPRWQTSLLVMAVPFGLLALLLLIFVLAGARPN